MQMNIKYKQNEKNVNYAYATLANKTARSQYV